MEWRTSLEKAMSVQITPKSTQHTGMAISTEGSVAAWQVTFQLDGDESLHAAISVSVAGPSTHQEAQQKALKLLQVFLSEACEAAKSTNFQIRTLPRPSRWGWGQLLTRRLGRADGVRTRSTACALSTGPDTEARSSPPNRHIRLATHGGSLQVVPTADDNLFSASNREPRS
jgi:hypothetical protein